MTKTIRLHVLAALSVLVATGIKAQENDFKVTAEADIVSQYIWRGQ